MRGPVEDALTAAASARVDALMQRRLVAAVCAPVGIEHLEDHEVLDQLASARGELLGGQPSGAPMALISQLGDRLTGIFACAVLTTFRWWLGAGLLLVWLAVRVPLADGLRRQASRRRSASEPLRRSWYLLGLAWKPPAAKEVRVFGLGDWVADRHRDEWLEGTAPAWAALRGLELRAWLAGAVVLGAYAVAAGVLGWAADHREVTLRTLATMLPMLPMSMSTGSISFSDISLEQLLSAVPDLDALSAALGRGTPAAERSADPAAGSPAAGLPRRAIALERLSFTYPGGREPVLRRLELELAAGTSLGLVGVNGAGKTTLVTLLARMREPTGGRITVDGVPLHELSAREWQRQVAVVYQDFARLPLTAAENVALFGREHPPDPSLLERAAAQAGVTEIVATRGGVLRALPRAHRRGHEHRHLPPVRDRSPGQPDRGARRRPDHRARLPRRAARGRRHLRPHVHPAGREVRVMRLGRVRRRFGVLVGTGFRAAPWTALACLVMGVAAAAAAVTYSYGFKVMIDGAIAHDSSQIALGAALVAVLFTAGWALAITSGTRGTMLTDRVSLVLGVRIARLAATLPTLEHFERSDLLARLEQLTDDRRTLAGAPRQLIGLLGQALRAIGIVVLLATVYLPVLVVPLLALAPAYSDRLAGRAQQRAEQRTAEDRRLLADLFALATSADSARELRTYGITGALADRHAELTERVRRRTVRTALVSAGLEAIGWLVFAAGLVGAIVALVLRAAHGHVTPGQVVMAVSLMRRAQTQISRSTDTASRWGSSLAAAGQLIWLEDHARALEQRSAAPVPARLAREIRLEGLRFAYPGAADRSVLGPIDLELPAGRTVALVGENGAGKTTLVKLLCGMYRPAAGRIALDGVDLAALRGSDWRERVSAAFQDFQRFQFTLADSVGVGDLPRLGDEGAVRASLERADLAALEHELPDGLATRIGNRFTGGRELSGGQWQRLALARGLMREAPLLVVLDEPTASLDAPTESALFERYAAAARTLAQTHGTITLLVSHRFSTVRAADLIVVLERGRVVEAGSHDQLIARDGTYAELFALQARAYA